MASRFHVNGYDNVYKLMCDSDPYPVSVFDDKPDVKMARDAFIKDLAFVFDQMRVALCCLGNIRLISDPDLMSTRVYETSPNFYYTAIRSFVNTCVMSVARLYPKSGNGLSLYSLLSAANKNSDIFSIGYVHGDGTVIKHQYGYVLHDAADVECALKIFRAQPDILAGYVPKINTIFRAGPVDMVKFLNSRVRMQDISEIVENVTFQRDKYYAHSEKEYVLNYNRLASEHPVVLSNFEFLLYFAEITCAILSAMLFHDAFFVVADNRFDILRTWSCVDSAYGDKIRNILHDITKQREIVLGKLIFDLDDDELG